MVVATQPRDARADIPEALEAPHRRVRVDATEVKTPSAEAPQASVHVVVLTGDEPLVEASRAREVQNSTPSDVPARR
jgi:hypothetical protein